MNKISVLTLFPESFEFLNDYGVIGKAIQKNLLKLKIVNIRDFSTDKHKKVDDKVFGGKAGMLMQAEPVYQAIRKTKTFNSKVIYMSPQGKLLDQKKVIELSKYDDIVLLCGHYEGVDSRVINHFVDEEISIGDYVLTGGEIPAMVLIDSVSRFIKGVLGNSESTKTDSHFSTLLQYDEFTRPSNFRGYKVPSELISGDPKKIDSWNLKSSIEKTKKIRKDLFDRYKRENSDGFN